jgi:hypothetical protein
MERRQIMSLLGSAKARVSVVVSGTLVVAVTLLVLVALVTLVKLVF